MQARPALVASIYVLGRPCLVIGEGDAAKERARRLGEGGAQTRLLAPAAFRPDACEGVFLVLCLDAGVGPAVSSAARRAGALVWVEDRPDLSDLAMPALARRGAITLAVSTDGRAPALARRLREELQRLLDDAGPRLDRFVDELVNARTALPTPGRKAALRALADRLSVDGAIRIA